MYNDLKATISQLELANDLLKLDNTLLKETIAILQAELKELTQPK